MQSFSLFHSFRMFPPQMLPTLAGAIVLAGYWICLFDHAFPAENPQQPQPALRVAGKFTGVNETEGIKLVSTVGAFNQVFQLEAIDREVKDLRISVAPFTGPNSNQVETSWMVNDQPGGTKLTLPALAAAQLKITASLPLEGPYQSVISLIYDNKRWPIPITITRTRPAPTVEVPPLEAVRNSSSLSSTGDVFLRMTLQETAGQELNLNRPMLVSLLLVQSDKNKAQAKYKNFIVTDAQGQSLDDPFVLKAREIKPLLLTMQGLEETGEFSGSISVSGPDVGAITRSVTIYKKKNGCAAGLLIFAGVLVSYLLRLYLTVARPRLIRERRVALVLSELEDVGRANRDLTVDEDEVLQGLRRRLNDVYEDVQMISDANGDASVNEVDRKLDIFPKWVSARRAVDALEPAELRRPFRDKLSGVKAFMLKTPTTSDESKTIETALDAIPNEVIAASRKDLTDRLDSFSKEVNRKRNETLSEDVRSRLSQRVDPKITEAQTFLKTDDLKRARASYDDARLMYARLSADDLAASFPKSSPRGFDDVTWNKFQADVTAELERVKLASNAEAATEAYDAAYAMYLRGLIWKLRAFGQDKQPIIEADSRIPPEERKEITQKIQEIMVQLEGALAKIDAMQLREARQDYEASRQKLEELVKKIEAKGVQMGAPGAPASAEAAAGSSIPEPFNLPFWHVAFSRKRRERPDPKKLACRLFWYDFIFTLFVLTAAVFFGLKLLWADNATWGSFNDLLTAVLWGLGLHQVSGVASEGVAGWATKITR